MLLRRSTEEVEPIYIDHYNQYATYATLPALAWHRDLSHNLSRQGDRI